WGPNGQPDAFSDKSWIAVLGPLAVSLVMQLMFFGIHLYTKKSGIKISAGNVTSSKIRQLRLRKYTSWFLFVANVMMTLLFTFIQLNVLYEDVFNHVYLMLVPLIFTAIMLAGSLGLAIRVGSVDSDLESKLSIDKHNKVERVDEDRYWIGGFLYFNRSDPSIFVEKRFGIGWTLNFANPLGYLIIFVPIILIILITSHF